MDQVDEGRDEKSGSAQANLFSRGPSNVSRDRIDRTNETRCNSRASMPSPRRPRDTHAPHVAIAKGADKAHTGGFRDTCTQGVPRERGLFFGSGNDAVSPIELERSDNAGRKKERRGERTGTCHFFFSRTGNEADCRVVHLIHAALGDTARAPVTEKRAGARRRFFFSPPLESHP